jgi:hypothetical protein
VAQVVGGFRVFLKQVKDWCRCDPAVGVYTFPPRWAGALPPIRRESVRLDFLIMYNYL